MTLIEEVKDIFNNRPKHKNKAVKKAEKENNYKDSKYMRRGSKVSVYPRKKVYRLVLIIMSLIAIAFLIMLILVDILPSDLTLTLVTAMMAMLVACSALFASKRKRRRVIGIMIAFFFCAIFPTMTSYMKSTYDMLNNISDNGISATGPQPKSVDITQEPFNVYITGIDQWAHEEGLDLERSDVNMLISVNPTTKRILLTSIPRDTYVKLHSSQQMDKLTHSGIYGVEETLSTVEDWFNIDINYYAKMNFTGARGIIDAMGGIDVYSPVAFTSSLKGYEYHKGWNKLDGKEAVYFVRERKAFEGQDTARVENQQRVMEAIIKKMTSSTTLLLHYDEIMEEAGGQLTTNLSAEELGNLVKMQVADLASWNILSQKIEGKADQDHVASLTQSKKFYIYRPSIESVSDCVNEINIVFNPSEQEIEDSKKSRSKSFFINMIKRLAKRENEEHEE